MAVDNIYYIGGVNRVGFDDGGSTEQSYYGSSFFSDPKGQILSQAGDDNDEVVYAEIDTSIIGELRNEWGFFRDRRPEVYAELST
jgi:N-carbamoylputrescine amidase